MSPSPVPSWFDEAKLGVFIHWNPAAIPAFAPVHLIDDLAPGLGTDLPKWRQEQIWRTLPYAEMYQNTLAVPGSETARFHAEHYGNRPYAAFAEEFRTVSVPGWDPEPWAELFSRAGAGYVVLTTKTEDGFLLWPSGHPNPRRARWQVTRDVVGELAAAVRERGIRFGTYYSEGMDWTFGGIPVTDGESLLAALPRGEEYAAYTDAHWRELIRRYRPAVLWNDYGFLPNPDADALLETYAEQVPDGVVNDRFDPRQHDGGLRADFVTLEYARTDGPADRKWEACRGIGTSFGYNRMESDASYLGSAELIHLFAGIVAAGGNLLINVGPDGAGHIPPEQEERLLALGRWLRTHEEAVRATRPWHRARGVTTRGVPVRYTKGREAVYGIVLGEPGGEDVDIDVRLAADATVSLLGVHGALPWTATAHGTRITLPGRRPEGPAPVLRMAPADAVRDPDGPAGQRP
ncbi:alpha-L-fucosidase [Streptomyces sp. MST-110588]|uniref:alpha-L-fucosidase n=1 Tax=Streptomyces sp. MST-110588 TaxID=2833628 RepID=UPI001F5CCFAC|nr:alpha-L-fucosidase [Streptomyces sp. MST-110588]UNO38641.1 alpha-L-fucosidase [Streptomyces sp. MST-110588]